jgi:hypothetical protein
MQAGCKRICQFFVVPFCVFGLSTFQKFSFAQPTIPKKAPVPPRIVPEAPLDPAKIRIEASPGAPRIIPNLDTPQSPAAVDPLELGHEKQANRFVMALCADKEGRLYIGTESEGIWRYDQKAPVTGRWRRFTTKDGLGDDNAYALACDNQGRIWVGHLNHGVSVFNGERWQNYDVLDGPLGERVFDIAVAPNDGSVWMATNAGLTRYDVQKDAWNYITRANGLPSDQISCLAFNAKGDLFAGTQCDGLAIARARDDYKTWKSVRGPERMPNAPVGQGLPGNLINDVLVIKEQSIYIATTCGLARSFDDGATWDYIRGADWEARVKGLYKGPEPKKLPVQGELLLEDYITCLAEDDKGQLWIGHWRNGYEVREAKANKRVTVKRQPDYVRALLPQQSEVMLGFYGAGALLLRDGKHRDDFELPPAQIAVPQRILFAPAVTKGTLASADSTSLVTGNFPTPAKTPTAEELKNMLASIQASKKPMPVNAAAYWGEDWTTKGDWVGRYGRLYGVLCGVMSPFDHLFTWNAEDYVVKPRIGPHQVGDVTRAWLHWMKTDKTDSLYDPILGYRRQAEWDDHGEEYSFTYEGPDTWIAVTLPEGLHRLSLYFFNKDGQEGNNRLRDYLIEVKLWAPTTKEAFFLPSLARARVRDFGGGGVYKQFVVQGGERYYIKIARNGSFNTICSGVFIDKLSGPLTRYDTLPLAWLGDVRYDPPQYQNMMQEVASSTLTNIESLQNAEELWEKVGQSIDHTGMAAMHRPARLLAYRAALKAGATEKHLANWRWALSLWTLEDRAEFRSVMKQAYEAQLKVTPGIRGN